DFSSLQKMPLTTLKVNYTTTEQESKTIHKITVTNTGKAVAFFVHLRALKGKDGDDILPIIFEDNYFLLTPGESRTIDCSYEKKDAGNTVPYILTSAWNIDLQNSTAGTAAGFINEMQ
ncbi:MAG TPA: glycoside hydrolase family 2 protein, partial [Chitinophagaceae bacterium]